MNLRRKSLVLAALLGVACTGKPAKPPEAGPRLVGKNVSKDEPTPAAPPRAEKEPPPPSGPARPWPVPKTTWGELGNGLTLASRRESGLPLVHLRVAVAAGSAGDGEKTGLAAVCARAMNEGAARAAFEIDRGDARDRRERRPRRLRALDDEPPFQRSRGVARDRRDEAQARRKGGRGRAPRARRRGHERSPNQRLFRRHDGAPPGSLPPAERAPPLRVLRRERRRNRQDQRRATARTTIADGSFRKTCCSPPRATSARRTCARPRKRPSAVCEAARRRATSFTDPMPPESTKISLVDHPGEKQSEIVIGSLAPPRDEASHGAFLVAAGILGGPYTGRLHESLGEQKKLATGVASAVLPFANGPSILLHLRPDEQRIHRRGPRRHSRRDGQARHGDAERGRNRDRRALLRRRPRRRIERAGPRSRRALRPLARKTPGRGPLGAPSCHARKHPDRGDEDLLRARPKRPPDHRRLRRRCDPRPVAPAFRRNQGRRSHPPFFEEPHLAGRFTSLNHRVGVAIAKAAGTKNFIPETPPGR